MPVRTVIRRIAAAIAASSLLLVGLVATTPASAAVTWVSGLSWSNLHVLQEPGVFEKYRREFDVNSVLQTQSDSQHSTAWIRTDRQSVTVRYIGGAVNANKSVQFLPGGDIEFTDSIAGDDNIALTDAQGNASITLTLTNPAQAEDNLYVGLRAGTAEEDPTVGNMVLLWQEPGFYPIIKLRGTWTGPESVCGINPYECVDSDLDEKTWAWSVFKRDWLPEYAQVFVKSYKAGSTIYVKYSVTDIWGTPLVGKSITLPADPNCKICKWGAYKATKLTDANGFVSYSVPNKNNVKEIAAFTSVNSDTKEKQRGFVSFNLWPTSNDLDESADMFWPQIVTDINIKATASKLNIVSRGGLTADAGGNVVVGAGTPEMAVNPPLALDTKGLGLGDTNVVNLTITYLKNSVPNVLYAPDIKVVASNGGRIGLVTNSKAAATFVDVSQMVSSLTFGYTYPQRLVFACTKPGSTIFTIYTGTTKKTHEMECVTGGKADARAVVAVANGQIGVPSTAANVQFKVTDRFGNGIAGVDLDVTSTGNGSIATPTVRVTSNAAGLVTVPASAMAAGAQTLTATVVDTTGTQFADPANATFKIAAGVATATSVLNWGTASIDVVAAKGAAKFTSLNLKGKTVTVTDGKKKYTYKPSSAKASNTIKLAKGSHKLVIKGGTVSKTVTITVP